MNIQRYLGSISWNFFSLSHPIPIQPLIRWEYFSYFILRSICIHNPRWVECLVDNKRLALNCCHISYGPCIVSMSFRNYYLKYVIRFERWTISFSTNRTILYWSILLNHKCNRTTISVTLSLSLSLHRMKTASR